MINSLLKNFCLITFALIAPITLPAGGIQKKTNHFIYIFLAAYLATFLRLTINNNFFISIIGSFLVGF